MWSDDTIERRLVPDIDAYRRDSWDNRPTWREKDSQTLRREEAKRRYELEQSIRERVIYLQISRPRPTEVRTRANSECTERDISYAAISRVGGGAALGTALGTAIGPGLGTVAGAVLGAVAGAFAPSVLPNKKFGSQENGKTRTEQH